MRGRVATYVIKYGTNSIKIKSDTVAGSIIASVEKVISLKRNIKDFYIGRLYFSFKNQLYLREKK